VVLLACLAAAMGEWIVGEVVRRGPSDLGSIGLILIAASAIGAVLAVVELGGEAAGLPVVGGLVGQTAGLFVLAFLAGLLLWIAGTTRELWAVGRRRRATALALLYGSSLVLWIAFLLLQR
jgi:hypothetical protein